MSLSLACPSDAGEVRVKSPCMFKEYWGNPAATAKAFDDDGWFLTGDTGGLFLPRDGTGHSAAAATSSSSSSKAVGGGRAGGGQGGLELEEEEFSSNAGDVHTRGERPANWTASSSLRSAASLDSLSLSLSVSLSLSL